jgi:hypothetical protein
LQMIGEQESLSAAGANTDSLVVIRKIAVIFFLARKHRTHTYCSITGTIDVQKQKSVPL